MYYHLKRYKKKRTLTPTLVLAETENRYRENWSLSSSTWYTESGLTNNMFHPGDTVQISYNTDISNEIILATIIDFIDYGTWGEDVLKCKSIPYKNELELQIARIHYIGKVNEI